jgi:hypothetical protein
MSNIVPTRDETELRDFIIGNRAWLGTATRERAAAWLEDAIVTHTRDELEAAKTRIAELEAENAGICRWVNEHCKLTGNSPELEVIRKYIEANNAAIAEAVRNRTVECADVAVKEFSKHNYTCGSDVHCAILALNAPPAPAYPFGKDATGRQCDHWKKKDDWWVSEHRDFLISDYTHCPFCGAPRTKGS